MMPSATQYIYSAAGVALPSLLHLHLLSVACSFVYESPTPSATGNQTAIYNQQTQWSVSPWKTFLKHWTWEGSTKAAIYSGGNV